MTWKGLGWEGWCTAAKGYMCVCVCVCVCVCAPAHMCKRWEVLPTNQAGWVVRIKTFPGCPLTAEVRHRCESSRGIVELLAWQASRPALITTLLICGKLPGPNRLINQGWSPADRNTSTQRSDALSCNTHGIIALVFYLRPRTVLCPRPWGW